MFFYLINPSSLLVMPELSGLLKIILTNEMTFQNYIVRINKVFHPQCVYDFSEFSTYFSFLDKKYRKLQTRIQRGAPNKNFY